MEGFIQWMEEKQYIFKHKLFLTPLYAFSFMNGWVTFNELPKQILIGYMMNYVQHLLSFTGILESELRYDNLKVQIKEIEILNKNIKNSLKTVT